MESEVEPKRFFDNRSCGNQREGCMKTGIIMDDSSLLNMLIPDFLCAKKENEKNEE